MKKQKLQQVRKIVKRYDDLKPWGQENQIKVLHFVAFATNCSLLYIWHHDDNLIDDHHSYFCSSGMSLFYVKS